MGEILGVLVAVLVGLQFFPNLMHLMQQSNDNTRAVATAQQQRQLIDASTSYLQQFATTLQATAGPTSPVVVTVPMLQAANNLLPSSFSAVNPYGQTWQVEVLQPSAGVLQALVMSTGGTALADTSAAKIAGLVGAKGGFIPKNDSGVYGAAATAYGAFGGWTLSTNSYTSIAGGHLASAVTYANGQISTNYLYRTAVGGQPQLNSMQTDLGMTDVGGAAHNISGAATIGAQTANVSGAVTAGTVSAAGGQFSVDTSGRIGTHGYAPTDLPGGWGGGISTADIYSHNTIAVGSGGGIAAYMNNGGQLAAGNGQFQVAPSGVVSIGAQGSSGTGCGGAANFATMTSDSAGVPLICQGGVWRPVGGRIQKFGFYAASDGTVIPSPSCPATAAPGAQVTMSNIYIDNTASASYNTSGAGPWTVLIRDGSNTPIPGGTAQVETFCVFS
jgi:hypothetical protein